MSNLYSVVSSLANKSIIANSIKDSLPAEFVQKLESARDEQRLTLLQSYQNLHGDEANVLFTSSFFTTLAKMTDSEDKAVSSLATGLSELLQAKDQVPSLFDDSGAEFFVGDEVFSEKAQEFLAVDLKAFYEANPDLQPEEEAPAETPAEIQENQEAPEQCEQVYSKEYLEGLGMPALRKLAAEFGVKGSSIKVLVRKTMKAQEEQSPAV